VGEKKKTKNTSQESGDGSDLDDDDDDDVLDLERRVEAALGSRALNHIAENAKAHNVKAFTADVRVCLSSFDEVLAGQHLADLPLEGATLFAGDDDHLVNPAAVEWLADRLPGNVGTFVYRQASHTGVQTLRRDDWLKAAATNGGSATAHRAAVDNEDEDTPVRPILRLRLSNKNQNKDDSFLGASAYTFAGLYRSFFGDEDQDQATR